MALDLLTSKYKEWLIEASNLATASTSDTMPIFAIESTTTNTPRTIPSISIPSELAHRLMRIATFAANLSSTRQMSPSHSPSELPLLITILGYYAEVRSLHLINRLTPLFRASSGDYSGNVPISTVGGGYQRGTHPLIRALQEFFGLAQAEGHFALLVLPSTVYNPSVSSSVASEGVRKALKHPSDLVRMTSEAIATRVGKAVIRGEFAEWVWIFDVVEVFNDLWVNAGTSQEGIMSTTVSEEEVALAIKSMEGVKEMILPALKAVTSAALQFLHRLVDNINSPPVTGVTGSANATVYEGTSMLLNCLKKMLEYERIIEALLRRWAQVAREESSAAEGMEEFIVGPLPSASAAEAGTTEAMVFSMALYYQDLLKGLEVTIERTSRDYRKAIIGILFQLNNFHYILRTIHSTPALADLITTESEQKYQLIEETLLKEYLNYWRTCASLMSDGGRGSSLSPKDRLKTFASELEELVRGQEACAVPDAELRIRLINFVREIVVPSFTTFYNMYSYSMNDLLIKSSLMIGINHYFKLIPRLNWIRLVLRSCLVDYSKPKNSFI